MWRRKMNIRNLLSNLYEKFNSKINKNKTQEQIVAEFIEQKNLALNSLRKLFSAPTYLGIIKDKITDIEEILIADAFAGAIELLKKEGNFIVTNKNIFYQMLGNIYDLPDNYFAQGQSVKRKIVNYLFFDTILSGSTLDSLKNEILTIEKLLSSEASGAILLRSDLNHLIAERMYQIISEQNNKTQEPILQEQAFEKSKSLEKSKKEQPINSSFLAKLFTHNLQNSALVKKYYKNQVSISLSILMVTGLILLVKYFDTEDILFKLFFFISSVFVSNSFNDWALENISLVKKIVLMTSIFYISSRFFVGINTWFEHREMIRSFATLQFLERLSDEDLNNFFEYVYKENSYTFRFRSEIQKKYQKMFKSND
ncbi:MAG: hypothetical protein KDK38_03665 [Leptospiraceae bacterium]|nr:hypothetical protein [Leptospiraceae bacterium]